MPDDFADEIGPVDYMVIEFPVGASHFNVEMAKELAALAEAELIRIYDALILTKKEDGTVEAFEIDDFDGPEEFRVIEGQVAEILALEDVAHLAAAMDPGRTAGVLVWENTWAAPLASAARRAGGQVVADGRIPIQAIIASLDADSLKEGA